MDFTTKLTLLKTSFFEDYIPQHLTEGVNKIVGRQRRDVPAEHLPAMDAIGAAMGYRPQEDVALGTIAGGAGVGAGALAVIRRQQQQQQALKQIIELAQSNKGVLSRIRSIF